jgi:hypothetical protein
MGARVVSFILYLALSYGVIYFLLTGTKWFPRGWNAKEPLRSAVIVAAIILIIVIGTMLVGPLPMVLLAAALVAFIAYIRSSDALPSLAATASELARGWHILSNLIGSIGQLKPMGLACYGLGCVRQPFVAAIRRALARLTGDIRSRVYQLHDRVRGLSKRGDDQAAQPLSDQSPPLINVRAAAGGVGLADGHWPDVERATEVPPKEVERRLTRDQAKRLLDHLEGQH